MRQGQRTVVYTNPLTRKPQSTLSRIAELLDPAWDYWDERELPQVRSDD